MHFSNQSLLLLFRYHYAQIQGHKKSIGPYFFERHLNGFNVRQFYTIKICIKDAFATETPQILSRVSSGFGKIMLKCPEMNRSRPTVSFVINNLFIVIVDMLFRAFH